MIKEGGVVSYLTWAVTLLRSSVTTRINHFKIAIEGILLKGGKPTKQSKELTGYLLNDCDFIGFVPNISYIMGKGDSNEIKNLWVHPFSTPTMLFKVKDQPLLVVANANLDYNDSVLTKIDHNQYSKEIMKTLKNIKGITG